MTKELSNSYPKDAVIIDLTTRANNLEGGKSRGSGVNPTTNTTNSSYGQGDSRDTPGCPWLEKWRIVKGKD